MAKIGEIVPRGVIIQTSPQHREIIDPHAGIEKQSSVGAVWHTPVNFGHHRVRRRARQIACIGPDIAVIGIAGFEHYNWPGRATRFEINHIGYRCCL